MNDKDNKTQAKAMPIHITPPPLALPLPIPNTGDRPLDRVKPQTEKKRSRELER